MGSSSSKSKDSTNKPTSTSVITEEIVNEPVVSGIVFGNTDGTNDERVASPPAPPVTLNTCFPCTKSTTQSDFNEYDADGEDSEDSGADEVKEAEKDLLQSRRRLRADNSILVPITVNSYWKNKNTCNTEYIWCYSSYYDKEGWWFMPAETNDQVERLYQNYLDGDTRGGGCTYTYNVFTYDFQDMKQQAHATGTVRNICRISTDVMKSLHDDYMSNILAREELWLCKMKESYLIYPPEIQDKLNNAEADEMIEFSLRLHNSYDYAFNLESMTQQNNSTNKMREIVKVNPSSISYAPIMGSFNFVYN